MPDEPAATAGTLFTDVAETPADTAPPVEPDWLREVPVPGVDPTAPPVAPPDPAAIAKRRAERAAEILKA
ncbi:MAG: ABC transporter permease, partial [Candidatus Limnocylindrales bacterium]